MQLSAFTATDPCGTNASVYYTFGISYGTVVLPAIIGFDSITRTVYIKSCNNDDGGKSYNVFICAHMPLYEAKNCSISF